MKEFVFMMDPPLNAWDISIKGGNRSMNLFCIDEELAFEVSGVLFFHNIKKSPYYEGHFVKGNRSFESF